MLTFQQLLKEAYAEKERYNKENHDIILSLNQKLDESYLEIQKLSDIIKQLSENKLENESNIRSLNQNINEIFLDYQI